jgi:isoleucyl-tRNA synthetase
MEKKWLAVWKENKTFKKSIENRPLEKEYTFYDGPPFATGLPHYGHILAGTMKDVVPRYQTMRGHRVERRFGWDCHGLPIENLIEKSLDLKSKADIEEKCGVDNFCEACRDSVLKYTGEWEATVERMGRWVDFKNDYKTMDPSYMESIWWVFRQLWDKDLIYQGKKSMHVCPRCVTPLSNFEVTLGYKDVKDNSVIWKFELVDEPGTYVLAWTTTPWSTLSTMGLSIGPDFDYLKVKYNDEVLIFAKERLDFVMQGIEEGEYEILAELKGSELVGKAYVPLLDVLRSHEDVKDNQNVYKIFAGDYVEVTEGTGLVTINGAYGEIDMEAAKKNDLPIVLDVDMNGHFNELAGDDYAGMYVKDMEVKFIENMNAAGKVHRTEKYKHSYPHCWRCDNALLNYATSAWFVDIAKIKDTMLAENAKVHWTPAHVGHGRFNDWLSNARDWCISRNRYWGAPLPVWVSEDCEDKIFVGSI